MKSSYPTPEILQTGNVLLCHTLKGVEAKAIRLVLGSYWNHAAITVVVEGNVYVVEAMGGRLVGILPYDRWCQEMEREVKVLPLTTTANNVLDLCGITYDKTSCWNLLLSKVTGNWYGRKEGKGKDKLYCFEYIALLYNLSEWWKATPQMLEAYYEQEKQVIPAQISP